jgi:hypothetical protein
VLSLTQLQTRRGMQAAMPGRYTLDGNPRVHIAVCGRGPAMQTVALEVARQGFGLEKERPLLTLVRTGVTDFSAGTLERLQSSEAVETRVTAVSTLSPDALDNAIASIGLAGPPLLAVHCVGDTDGEAEELARRWEQILLDGHHPVPPIVAYADGDRQVGRTGMIRIADAPDLAEASEVAALMDQRAIAVHRQYYEAQKAAGRADFGKAPAEVPWERLSEGFRDDNRAVADQMDYKLARAGMAVRKGSGSAPIDPAMVETLAEVAHARWMASKSLGGHRYGPVRDKQKLLHPDMLAYKDLTPAAQQKDRDEVATLPQLAALAGEALVRERRFRLTGPLDDRGLDRLCTAIAALPSTEMPVVVVPLGDATMVATAKSLAERAIAIAAVLDIGTDGLRRNSGSSAPILATLLHRAWRIHVATGRSASDAAAELAPFSIDLQGAIHA